MRTVLFDEDVPRPLRRELPGFDIRTVVEMGWSGVMNGELLRRAEAVFDVFLTADQNLEFQQNIPKLRLGVVVLAARSTKLDDLVPLSAQIASAMEEVHPGQLLHVPPSTE